MKQLDKVSETRDAHNKIPVLFAKTKFPDLLLQADFCILFPLRYVEKQPHFYNLLSLPNGFPKSEKKPPEFS